MQLGYEIWRPRGRSDSPQHGSSQQGEDRGQLPKQSQNQGFSNGRFWRPVPPNGKVLGVGGNGSLRIPTSSQGSSLGMPGPQGPTRTRGGFQQVPPPPIDVRPHNMLVSTDMSGGGMAFPPGLTPTGPFISWTYGNVPPVDPPHGHAARRIARRPQPFPSDDVCLTSPCNGHAAIPDRRFHVYRTERFGAPSSSFVRAWLVWDIRVLDGRQQRQDARRHAVYRTQPDLPRSWN